MCRGLAALFGEIGTLIGNSTSSPILWVYLNPTSPRSVILGCWPTGIGTSLQNSVTGFDSPASLSGDRRGSLLNDTHHAPNAGLRTRGFELRRVSSTLTGGTMTRKHYAANKPQYAARNKRTAEEKRAFIQAAKNVPCGDCGVSYPYYVMEFDHVRGLKAFNVSTAVQYNPGWERLKAEIAKCDVVCSNCHRERTYRRNLPQPADSGAFPAKEGCEGSTPF